jgi:hypothetical protein
MAIDNDILKTLQSIEKLLKSTSSAASGKSTFSQKFDKIRGKKQDDNSGDGKTFQAFTKSMDKADDALLGLSSNLSGLNKEVGRTTSGFSALNAQMSKFMSALQVTPPGVTQAAGAPRTRIPGKNGLGGVAPGITIPAPAAGVGAASPMKQVMGRMLQNFGQASVGSGGLALAFGALIDATKRVTGEYFNLAEMGMGSVSNLATLSKNALMSGMALKEYTALIGSSINVASRAGNLENFQKIISAQDAQLAAMGVFGAEARAMQASLAQSSAQLGVPIGDLTKATSSQIDIFDKLRKSSNMTASEFASMTRSVANSEEAQKELLGLAPSERIARMNQLVQLNSIGTKMGMAADASAKLGQALMAARQSTVKERIDTSGLMLQMGAFTGNGAAGQRGMELQMKGRRRTEAEDEELLQISQTFERSAQTMYQQGSLGVQNVLDQFEEQSSKGAYGQMVKAGRGKSLAEDTGTVNQVAFGQHVGEFGQAVGKLTSLFNGFEQSVLGPLVAGLGGGLLTMFRGPIVNILSKALGFGGGAAKAAGAVASAAGGGGASAAYGAGQAVGKTMSYLSNAFSTGKSAIAGYIQNVRLSSAIIKDAGGTTMEVVGQVFKDGITAVKGSGTMMADGMKSFTSVLKASAPEMKAAFVGGLDVLKGGAGMLWTGLKGITKIFGPLSGLIDAAIEMFTGDMSDALNPSGGVFNRMGGMITAFFTAIPNMLIDALAFVFGDENIQPLKRGFDLIVGYMNFAIKDFLARLAGGAADLMESLPFVGKDSRMVKMLRGWQDGLVDSATENVAMVEKLWDNNSATMASISKENKAVADKQSATSEQAATKVVASQSKFNNVMEAGAVTAASVYADAAALAAPQVQVAKQVSTAPVNTADQQTAQAQAAAATQQQQAATVTSDLASVMQSILQVLRENLPRQTDSSEALVKLVKPQTSFQSAEDAANQLLRRR